MAHIQKYYVSDILKEVCSMMGGITKNVFPDHRPSAKGEQMDELIVVSIPSELQEQNAWQKGILRRTNRQGQGQRICQYRQT